MILLLCLLIAFPDQALSQTQITELTDSAETPTTQHLQNLGHRHRTRVVPPEGEPQDSISNTYTIDVAGDTVYIADMDSVQKHAVEAELLQTELQAKRDSAEYADYGRQRAMKINPMRSLWLSALCPGL